MSIAASTTELPRHCWHRQSGSARRRVPAAAVHSFPCFHSTGCRPTVTLVCKHWWHCFYAEPSLWCSFELGASRRSNQALPKLSAAKQTAWFAAKYALLQRTAGLVQEAKIGCNLPLARTRPCSLQQALDRQSLEDGWQLVDFVSLLPSASLTSLRFWAVNVPAAVLRLLPRLGHLADLGLNTHRLPGAAAAAVEQQTQLRRLYLHTGASIPAAMFSRLPSSAELRHLGIHSEASIPAAVLSGLLTIAQLTQLSIYSEAPFSLGDLRGLSRLTALHTLKLSSGVRRWPAPQGHPPVQQAALLQLPTAAALPRLHSYQAYASCPIQVHCRRPDAHHVPQMLHAG